MIVLVLTDYYLPGFKAGGPIRSLSYLIDLIGTRYSFRVITRDRDRGDRTPYAGASVHEWTRLGQAEVCYLAPRELGVRSIASLLRKTRHDVLFLNSFFSPRLSILPTVLSRFGLTRKQPILIAPRGELAAGALTIKPARKKIFLRLARWLRLYRDVIWISSSEHESYDIRRQHGPAARVVAAPEVYRLPAFAHSSPRRKARRALSLVFLARINKVKNLHFALQTLEGLRGDVTFDIYGPMEDPIYWAKCQDAARMLSTNVRVKYKGPVSHDEVAPTLARYHLLFLPTLGENFGHVIVEALGAGCPVLISNRTPWRGLSDSGIGWDLALEKPQDFRRAIEQCIEMGPEEFNVMSGRALAFAGRYASASSTCGMVDLLDEFLPSKQDNVQWRRSDSG